MDNTTGGTAGKKVSGVLRIPVLPLRDIVVFPHMIVPLFVGRQRSIRALEAVTSQQESRRILLVTQKDASTDDPTAEDINSIGVEGTILQILKLPDSTVKVLIEGGQRIRVHRYLQRDPYFFAEVTYVEPDPYDNTEALALMRSLARQFESYSKLNKRIAPEVVATLQGVDNPADLADIVATHITMKVDERQELLQELSVLDRMERLLLQKKE